MRLIDADALIDALGGWEWQELYLPVHFKDFIIDEAPTIDAVPLEQYQSMEATCVKLQKAIADTPQVVRCKDCKWYQDNATWEDFINHCKWISTETPDDDDFCSYGERKDDED